MKSDLIKKNKMNNNKKLLAQKYMVVLDKANLLGAGSFASVYKGVNVLDNSPVAIKVIDFSKMTAKESKM